MDRVVAKVNKMKRLNDKGFSLLEVLVAVVILAVGLLAAASMQTTALTATTTSRNTTLAVQLAEEMVDRIRVNAGTTPDIYDSNPDIDINMSTESCSSLSNATALGDCNQWRDRLTSSGLPNPSGTVLVELDEPIDNAAKITVEISWGTIGVKRMKVITIMETRVS